VCLHIYLLSRGPQVKGRSVLLQLGIYMHVTRVAAPTPSPQHLDIFKGAPLRRLKPLSDQFAVRVLASPLYINCMCICMRACVCLHIYRFLKRPQEPGPIRSSLTRCCPTWPAASLPAARRRLGWDYYIYIYIYIYTLTRTRHG